MNCCLDCAGYRPFTGVYGDWKMVPCDLCGQKKLVADSTLFRGLPSKGGPGFDPKDVEKIKDAIGYPRFGVAPPVGSL